MTFKIVLLVCFVIVSLEDVNGDENSQKKDVGASIRRMFMYKGTKWCGPGHTAKSYNDLGRNRESDKCCREHDRHCPKRIPSFKMKYGLLNFSYKVASLCRCEVIFKNCLLKVNNAVSRDLFQVYFYKLKPRCIRIKKERKRVCVRRNWFWCKKFAYVTIDKAHFVDLHKAVGL